MAESQDLFDMFDQNDSQVGFSQHSTEAQNLVSQTTTEQDLVAQRDKAAPPLPPHRRRQVRELKKKMRRKRRRRILITILIIAFIVGLGFGGVALTHKLRSATQASTTRTAENLDYPGPGSGSVEVTFEEGEGTAQFAQKLVNAGVIRSVGAFTSAVSSAHAENKLQAGTFTLKKKMAAADVVTVVTDASKISGSLVVRPGETLKTVIASAVKMTKFSQEDFDALTASDGSGILPNAAGGKWEGWFEPGTYNVKSKTSSHDILAEMVNKRIAKLQSLGVSEDQYETVLSKASIVEGEVNHSEYYGKVARVIENRLAQDMPLGMDSVIAYSLGINARQLTVSQLSDASNPYNDRINKGLPPTPINMPSDDAIKAVMNPEQGDWIYFVTVNLETGETKFTADESQFQEFSKEYQSWEANH
ncbi:endolytic transglycosylase MltG [Alloscardovia venturai]|uniref:Endolytic murein transglycosylase n=1 Tax=Alloscardovia venturai TaxID=1769421 RepID=A0ABW2Y6S3_9BIFI